jgi:hypothetical protein
VKQLCPGALLRHTYISMALQQPPEQAIHPVTEEEILRSIGR